MIADRDGVEAEFCPRCRGGRFDPGKLAGLKIGDRFAAIVVGEHDGRRILGNGKDRFSRDEEAFWGDELFDR